MSCHAHLQVVSTQPGPWVTMANTKPENYLALSLFTCLCCCWMFGIIALIMSLQVRWLSCMTVKVQQAVGTVDLITEWDTQHTMFEHN